MLLAGVHAATIAVMRPLYQVSDEVVYLSTVQAMVLFNAPPVDRSCVAPPVGAFPHIPVQVKPGFLRGTAWQLRVICGSDALRSWSLVALRMAQAPSLAVLAGCAWALARLLTGRATDAFLAGLMVAGHPVAAVYAGAVTPDAWGNALAAVAILAGTRLLVGQGGGWAAAGVIAAPIAALGWKDTNTFLLALPPVALALHTVRSPGTAGVTGARTALVLGAAAVSAVAGLRWFRTPYASEANPVSLSHVLDLAGAIVADLLPQLGSLVVTSWVAIGNFGASALTMSTAPTVLGGLLCAAGLMGALRRVSGAQASTERWIVAIVWATCAILCAAQPSARQVLLNSQDIHQGRWLFPMLAPAAVVLAYGLNGLGTQPRILPLWTLAMLSSTWLALADAGRFYWLVYPSALNEAGLYLRGTGGAVIGETSLLQSAHHAALSIPGSLPLVFPVLLAFLSAAALLLACATASGVAHVRHADHR